MDIQQATRSFEQWLAKRTPLLSSDLRLKHAAMAESPLPFLRATYYRWSQIWPEACADFAKGPRVLAVGDLHIENFGTWRDAEGRLIWGINDFDDAAPLPYTNDLIRLATSILLAIEQDHLSIKFKLVCSAILEGYGEALRKGGEPFVIGEHHRAFIPMIRSDERNPVRFWAKLRAFAPIREGLTRAVKSALQGELPDPKLACQYVHRIAGLGSLGKQRIVALANWHGSTIAREAKALTIPATEWSRPTGEKNIYYTRILAQAVRCPDPFVRAEGTWLLRRLAPDCSRIELASIAQIREDMELLHAVGWETANIHLGSGEKTRRDIEKNLARLPANWLRKAARLMAEATLKDWRRWRKE